MTSLGFSAVAEHAHRNQGRFPLLIPWIKELYRLTNTAGASFRFKLIIDYIITVFHVFMGIWIMHPLGENPVYVSVFSLINLL